jgi:YesN/AraC family two-component response regulator
MNHLAVGSRGQPPRVLVLDDDHFMLSMLKDMLERIGVQEIYTEANTRHALSTLAETSPDMLICDLALPDMDGIEFMQAAAERGFRGGVILLSGMDSGDYARPTAGRRRMLRFCTNVRTFFGKIRYYSA